MATLDLSSVAFGSVPMTHQVRGLEELTDHPRWGLFWEQGTGKTAPTCYRLRMGFDAGEFQGDVLIVCPLSVVGVWQHELQKHAGLECVIATGDRRSRATALERRTRIVVTNYEAARSEVKALTARRFDVVVLDEAHRAKNTSTQTSRRLRKIARKSRYRWALTGTPASNSPLDVFGILTFLDPSVLGTESKMAFERRHAVYSSWEVAPGVRKIVDYMGLDVLQSQVGSISSRVLKEDCLDLPEKTFQTVAVELSPAARRVYRELKAEAIATLGESQLTAANVLTQAMRLLQVAGGFVPDDEGDVHALTPNAKIDTLVDLLEDREGEKVVIWCGFRAEVAAIVRALGTHKAAPFHGGMGQDERQNTISKFRWGDVSYLVSTSAGREGLTLTEAATSIFYSRTYQLLDWLQAQDRIHRIGQERKVTILSLVAKGTVDERIAAALESKTTLQELLLAGARLQDLF